MKTIATIFSGGEGVGVGAKAAGIEHLWGIEHDAEIASVACLNGFAVAVGDVTTVDPHNFKPPDILHASPPCPNFSSAKTGAVETEHDIELARATARFIETLTPKVFTLENVWMYRKSQAWALIENALNRLGYWTDVKHLNSADFGVPQTRKRMIVRAIRGGWLPPLPAPEPWQGWYSAIEDLLPGLPDSEFAPWQLDKIPKPLLHTLLVDSAGYPDDDGIRVPVMRRIDEPANTIVANFSRRPMRAFIIDGQNAGQPNLTIRGYDEAMFTVVASAAEKGMAKAAIPGRVVRMDSRCLARFQSFFDSYRLPEKATPAVRVIGNAVPPLMYQRIIEQFAEMER